eukprot:GDKI01035235.1.p1 GENE.GDKI01035235.1~~GDKI01035235.1.p1  ORF type:complete len:134 (+),score=37.17 GDKI01035235.1:82-483(+)
MEHINKFLTSDLPVYLATAPIPKTFSGFTELSADQWMQLSPLLTSLLLLVLLPFIAVALRPAQKHTVWINKTVEKSKDKVVTTCTVQDIEDLASKKAVYCRCWKSATFPLCDGSHNKHNQETGDNVGPLIVKK